MVSKRFFSRGLVAGIAVAAALAVAPVTGQAKQLKWAFQGDAASLDPHSLNESFQLSFLGNIYESLVWRDRNMKIIPSLAESWEIVSPNVWRFKLRKGVKFHNGNAFTADDVIFSYIRSQKPGSDVPTKIASIKEIKKIDDHTIEIVTKAPNPILTSDLSDWYIMDKEWAEKNGATGPVDIRKKKENFSARNTNGTGPFMLKSRQQDVKTVLVPNPNWWGKKEHNITEVIFTPVKSDATRVAALLSGELDMVYPVPLQDAKRLERAKGVTLLAGPEARTIFLGMDQFRDELLYSNVKGKNPFKDKRVRQAFYYAIDVNAIKSKIMRGSAWPSALMVAPQVNGFDKKLNGRPKYDPAAAKKLLAAAGYPKGFEVGMDCPNNRYVNDERICQAVVSMLAKVGVRVKLTAQPKSKYFAKVLKYDTSFYLLGWTPTTFDSHNPLANLIVCLDRDTGKGKFNLGGYCNPKIDALADKIQSETDQAKRQSMISAAFKMLKDEYGYIPLHQQPLSWGKKDNIELAQRPDNFFDMRFVRVK